MQVMCGEKRDFLIILKDVFQGFFYTFYVFFELILAESAI